MRVVFLGTGTLYPEPEKASTGLAVFEDERALALDVGRNVLSRMVECGLDPLALDELLLSHVHPDHSCELVSLLFARNYAGGENEGRPLRITGPPGVAELVRRLGEAWRWVEPRFELAIEEVDGGWQGERAGFAVEAVRMQHGDVEARGFRVRGAAGSPTLAFTGDTGPGPGLRSLAEDCDLLVAECAAAGERSSAVHLTPETLADAVVRAGTPRLAVTHLQPATEPTEVLRALRAATEAEVLLADDRLGVEL